MPSSLWRMLGGAVAPVIVLTYGGIDRPGGAEARAGSAAPPIETLATTPRPIRDFAQDGGRIAWIDGAAPSARGDCSLSLHVATLRPLRDAPTRLQRGFCSAGALVLGGRHALWAHRFGGAGTQYTRIDVAASGARTSTPVMDLGQDDDGTGPFLTATAADGTALLYAEASWGTDPPNCDPTGPECRRSFAGGRLMRVRGGIAREVSGAPPPALIAVAGARVAVVPVDPASPFAIGAPRRVRASPAVEIRALSGALVTRIDVSGRISALAVSARLLGIVIRQGSGGRLEIRDATSGQVQAAVMLPEATTPELSLSATAAVFRTGRSIRVFELASGRQRVVAQAASVPVGLSIEGDRVAWAENIGGRGRIRALVLSRRARYS